ncbi:MAG: DUF6448 family protein [Vicinamibacteria bacterium]
MKPLSRILVVSLLLLTPRFASAHCDTLKGPVVTAARAALEARDVNLVLAWVRPADEAVIRHAFQETLTVRALGPDAKVLADRYFFETLVRIHRAGEGAPYTGLTESEPEPTIAATDRALERGSVDELERLLVASVRTGLLERFAHARAAKPLHQGDVAAGRAYVAAYVSLTHWVEGVATAAEGSAEHHGADAAQAGHRNP